MTRPVLRTTLCDLLDIEYPVILAGMGGRGLPTPPALVAAVSNAGGLGVLGGSGMEPEELRRRIREVRRLTDRPFGVDLLLPASLADTPEESRDAIRRQLHEHYPEHVALARSLMVELGLPDARDEREMVTSPLHIRRQVAVILEERAPVFAAALGDPSWMVPDARAQGMTVIGLAGSARHAQRHVDAGVDIVVAQGHEAGGHTGRIGTLPLVRQTVEAVAPVPVVAAGGIGDGRSIAAALALGAVGAWVGTAFLVAEECRIYEEQKEQLLRASAEDLTVSRTYTGKTVRGHRNAVVEAWERSGLQPLPMPLQQVLMDDFVAAARQTGRYDLLLNLAGQGVGMVRERKPAASITEELVRETVETLERLPSHVTYRAGSPS